MTKKVLIVDDNEHLRQLLASILRFSGYAISEAATGTQAIEKAVSAKPHLILMDIDLPDITGADAAQAIRKDPRTAHIPIVGCSAHLGWEFRDATVIRAKIEEFILTERKTMSHIESKPSATTEELLVSSLAQTDALAKLLIEKSIITQQEFLQKTAEERATYQRMINPNPQ